MHVNCDELESAEKLLGLARGCGFKLSGIISVPKATVEIRSSERIDVPVEIIDPNTLDVLLRKANEKLKETHKKISKLKINLKKLK
jgi:tRNA(Phe) wybutosine-synthesizing methylase Tyw3